MYLMNHTHTVPFARPHPLAFNTGSLFSSIAAHHRPRHSLVASAPHPPPLRTKRQGRGPATTPMATTMTCRRLSWLFFPGKRNAPPPMQTLALLQLRQKVEKEKAAPPPPPPLHLFLPLRLCSFALRKPSPPRVSLGRVTSSLRGGSSSSRGGGRPSPMRPASLPPERSRHRQPLLLHRGEPRPPR